MKITHAFIAAKEVLKSNFLLGTQYPLSVYISVTDRCPHACEYCNIPNRRLREMSTQEIIALIRQIKEAGAVRLQIVGGEPLLRDDIGKIVDYAKESGLYVSTSSTGFPKEKIASIKNIDMLFLSFDGEKEVHDYQKGQGRYENLMEAMDILKKLKVNFCTTTVFTKINKDSMDFILRTAQEKRFTALFQPLYYTLVNYTNHFHLANVASKFVLSNEEMRKIFNKLIVAKRNGAPIASSLPYLEYLSEWQDYRKIYSPQKHKGIKCWAGRLYCYIDTNGLLYPCGDSIGVVEGMDCLESGFKEAFSKINLNRNCQSCIVACDLEKNLMFSLNIKTIINWLKLVM